MPLESGTRLGPYEIIDLLASGGMGVIYRARDPRLARQVAIKVLPRRVSREEEALQRFERETKAIAALSHPNILAIHDVGKANDRVYAVMELLEGETLRQRLNHGPLPYRKAIDLAIQTARGLAAAHDKGIVHRDLKPENIFLTNAGHLKILDFGLAAPSTRGVTGPNDTQPVTPHIQTDTETVLGTAAYMAPEQVRDLRPDARTDLFSLGSILYEMLTGKHAFLRETSAETMTAVLREEPELLDEEITPFSMPMLAILRHCLEKRPEERFQSARDLAFDLTQLSLTLTSAAQRPETPTGFAHLREFLLAAGLILALAIGAGLHALISKPPRADPVRHTQLTFSGHDRAPSASPDGRTIAFTSDRDGLPRIWLKQFPGENEVAITSGPDDRPRISPSGSSVLYVHAEGRQKGIYRVALIGGAPHKLIDDAYDADWSPDGGRIVYFRSFSRGGSPTSVVLTAEADGSEPTELCKVEGVVLSSPRWSPDGRWIAAIETRATNTTEHSLILIDSTSGDLNTLSPSGSHNIYSAVAWTEEGPALIYARSTSPLGGLSRTSNEVLVRSPHDDRARLLFWAQNLFTSTGVNAQSLPVLDVLGDGKLVYDIATSRQNLRSYSLGPPRAPLTTHLLTLGNGRDRQPAFSADGTSLMFSSNRSGNLDLWTVSPLTGEVSRLTEDEADDWDPAFTPDGHSILWSSDRSGNLEIWISNPDGTNARQITNDGADAENPTMTADGRWIVYASGNPKKLGIWKIHPDGTDATRLVSGPRFLPEVSPDGRYVVFMSNDSEHLRNILEVVEVESGLLVPFKILVPYRFENPTSLNLGRPRWMPDGSAIAFTGENEEGETGVFVQDFRPGLDTSGTRRPVAGFIPGLLAESFGIRPDGLSIVVAEQEEVYGIMLASNVPEVIGRHPNE